MNTYVYNACGAMFVVIINVFHLLSIHNRSIFDEFIHLNIVQCVLHTSE